MLTAFSHLTLLVTNQQEALDFYTQKLGFTIHTDAIMHDGSRWITLCLAEQPGFELALMQASGDDTALVDRQGGSYPFACLTTNDCIKTYETLQTRGVEFVGKPIKEEWGTAVLFKDLYGNVFYLCQPA